ncbi:MAG: hypothetical protein OXC26_00925, partial [Albidovulum sp.]|nr:hypothetical protein [Albidovulum sp.]
LDHIRTVIDYAVFQDWSALLRTIATADLPEKPPRPAIASPQTKQSAVPSEIRPNMEKIENELILRITGAVLGLLTPSAKRRSLESECRLGYRHGIGISSLGIAPGPVVSGDEGGGV